MLNGAKEGKMGQNGAKWGQMGPNGAKTGPNRAKTGPNIGNPGKMVSIRAKQGQTRWPSLIWWVTILGLAGDPLRMVGDHPW